MGFLNYQKGQTLYFNAKKCCGLWLLIIGTVIIIATALGGRYQLNPIIFAVGYFAGFYVANINKQVHQKLSDGPLSPFQYRMAMLSVIILFVRLVLIAGWHFITMNWRLIWLGAFLATGLHFLFFYFVHGKAMIVVAILSCISAVLGILFPSVPFAVFGYVDGFIKLAAGIFLLFFSKPTTNKRQ